MSHNMDDYVQPFPAIQILNHTDRIIALPVIFLWVYIKDNAYHDKPCDQDHLKTTYPTSLLIFTHDVAGSVYEYA
jgi:hypothetical protein